MTDIETYLSQIINERFAKDVRQAIRDAIYQCYYDSKVGALDLVARQQIANLVSENNPTEGNSELHDIRVGADGTIYDSAGEAVRQQIETVTSEIAAILEDDTKDFATIEFDEETRLLHFYDESGADVYEPVLITGGGGGGTGGTVTTVVRLTNENGSSTLALAAGGTAELKFTFISTENDVPTGGGSCQITVNGVSKANININQGLNTIDVSKFLTVGSNTVRVKCTDMYGNYRVLVYTISVIDLYITSTFNDSVPYDSDITFKFTPYGAIEKTIHVLIDGSEFRTWEVSSSGKQSTLIIPKMSHGVHKIELYMTAELGGAPLESDHLVYDIICITEGATNRMIASSYFSEPVVQGELISIPYIVYDPTKLACDITLDIYTKENGSEILYSSQSLTVDRQKYYWNTRKYPVGIVYFRIKYVYEPNFAITKEHVITVEENDIKVEAETNDLELYLSSNGRSNNEASPSNWSYKGVSTVFSNVNWSSTGWLTDDNGDTCLRLNGDAKAEIQFKPFSEDIRTYGKTLELEFAIRDVNNRNAIAISCMSGGIGFEIKPDTAHIVSEQSEVFCNYKEEEKVRLTFVVESRDESRLLSIYLNGVLSDVIQYPDTDNFQQSSPVNITIGSEYCCVDLYTIRSYTTALTSPSIINNFIADMADVGMKTLTYENNDIYDDYGNISFEKVKEKNSVMVITGALPVSKGDKKNVKVSYYDLDNPNIDYVDNNVVIDVQGTSSQWYVRKNWKLKFSEEHYIDINHLPAKVMCIKVDYAEATGTHNTQNANLIHTFYEEQIPPQAVDPKTRTTIYGKPILLFHQANETSDPVFYGKANYNYDKGAESVFGFTNDYDVECWEFLNNTSDACNFRSSIPANWKDDFEARYPEGRTDISRLKALHNWVISTKDKVDKFRYEFEQHFDLHYCLIYYVYTFFALMVDQRAKNMFLTYWGSTGKWQPWFYDNDTCFGINNEGQLVYDYYHEDTDKVAGVNVYTGQNSLLWSNFREAFADEIKETYQNLRNNGYITYDKMVDRFITNGSDKWSESIYNEDGEFKYISMLRSDNDATNLPQVRGSGEEHFRYFIKNRLNYCDSKWYAADYANDYASIRISTPTEWAGIEPKADITLTAYSDMYAGVRYTASTSLQQKRVKSGESVTFEASADDTFSGTETAIYGASQISSLGDLAPLYCSRVDVANADKLTELKIGDTTEGYSNPNMIYLSVGTNKLLRFLDIRNCPNLAISLDLSGCPNIEEVYASGTAITGIEFADVSGCLKKASLPTTIANLTIKNQAFIEEIIFDGYDGLKTLHVENCPTFDTLSVLSNGSNIERVRLTNVNWSYDDSSALLALIDRNISGIDENGANIDNMWIDGTCHIKTIVCNEMSIIKTAFPHLKITYDTLTTELIYMSWDGTTELHRETIINAGDGVEDPVANGIIETPTRESTAQYDFAYAGWSLTADGYSSNTALLKVESTRYVYVAFTKTLRSYTVSFYNGSTLLETVTAKYGSTATYTGATPVIDGVDNAEEFEFTGWEPSPTNIQGVTSCYAQYYNTYIITEDWSEIPGNTNKYRVGQYKALTITNEDGTTESIEMEVAGLNHDELSDDMYIKSVSTTPWYRRDGVYSAIEYKGELYVFAGGWVYTWDGANWSYKNVVIDPDNPNRAITAESAVIYNDKLCFTTSEYLFAWDGSSCTKVCELPYYGGRATLVVYDGELHVVGGVTFTNSSMGVTEYNKQKHYKFDGTTWVNVGQIVEEFNWRIVFVYDDKIHIIGQNTQSIIKHYCWDGYFHDSLSPWIDVSGTPSLADGFYIGGALNSCNAVVHNDRVYFLSTNVGGSYQTHYWVLDGTSWTKLDVDGPRDHIGSVVAVYNDELHILGGRDPSINTNNSSDSLIQIHWKLVTPSWELHDMPDDYRFNFGSSVVYNNAIHVFGGATNPNAHYKYDGYEWTELDVMPYGGSTNFSAVVLNNEIHILGVSDYPKNHFKWTGTEWVDVGTLPVELPLAAVYNNTLHIFKEKLHHYTFNGTNWSNIYGSNGKTNLMWVTGPERDSIIVDEGGIHIFGGSTDINEHVYFINGTNAMDRPPLETYSPFPHKIIKPHVTFHNGEMHLIGGSNVNDTVNALVSFKHYKSLDSGLTWKLVEKLPYPIYKNCCLVDFREHMHIMTPDQGLLVYKNPAAALTFFAKAALKNPRKMNDGYKTDGTNTSMNCGGWAESDLREWLDTELYTILPDDLKAAIKRVIKWSDGGYYNKTVVGTEDKIWIPSYEELGLPDSTNNLIGQGNQYQIFTDNASRQRHTTMDENSQNYWSRSTLMDNANYFWIIGGHGGAIYTEATNGKINIVFGFCI